MTINYRFDGEYFDYDVEYEESEKALFKILTELVGEEVANLMIIENECSNELEKEYMEELKDYFEEVAYKEYLDRRYE